MKSVSADTSIMIPLAPLVEALRPAVVDAIINSKQSDRRARRKDASAAIVDAAGKVSAALARYEAAVGTPNETRTLNQLIAASKGIRRALKLTSNTL